MENATAIADFAPTSRVDAYQPLSLVNDITPAKTRKEFPIADSLALKCPSVYTRSEVILDGVRKITTQFIELYRPYTGKFVITEEAGITTAYGQVSGTNFPKTYEVHEGKTIDQVRQGMIEDLKTLWIEKRDREYEQTENET